MADQEVVFSEFIAGRIEAKIGKLEAEKVPARVAIARLSRSLEGALERGVPESALLEVLRENGIRLSGKAFRKLLEEGRSGTRIPPGSAGRAAGALNGGGGGRNGGGSGDGEADPPGDPGRGDGDGTGPGQATSRQ